MIRHKHKAIPVYIVEDHDDVLPQIYRNIGSGYLPFEGNTIIHFDSHPDLLISETLEEADAWNKEALFEELSIENWILPGCYTGQFSKVCWIKPHWSTQIDSGNYRVVIGEHKGLIRLGTPIYYFLSDGIVVDRSLLKKSREFDLVVATWPNEENDFDVSKACLPHNQSYILDIDLDFFSTKDPFLFLKAHPTIMNQLSDLFCLNYNRSVERSDEELINLGAAHSKKLELLKNVFESLEPTVNSDATMEEQLMKFPKLPEDIHKSMCELSKGVREFYKKAREDAITPEFDWMQIYNVGRTCDLDQLPHHVSTMEEIEIGVKHFESFLRKLPYPPTIITIARSSLDDYCPINRVDTIQAEVTSVLEKVFGAAKLDFQIKYKQLGPPYSPLTFYSETDTPE